MLIQILVVGASIGLIVVGIKGFTAGGLALSRNRNLTGKPAKIVGAICIVAGIAFIPLFLLFMWSLSN